ncbi:MAG: hypothetical protein P4L31_01040, partial [Candidatus Babeliales bacterium]|nr:hypothetical protein [Candidatus Babeliales bacterium]
SSEGSKEWHNNQAWFHTQWARLLNKEKQINYFAKEKEDEKEDALEEKQEDKPQKVVLPEAKCESASDSSSESEEEEVVQKPKKINKKKAVVTESKPQKKSEEPTKKTHKILAVDNENSTISIVDLAKNISK